VMAGLPSARPPTRRPQCRGVASIVVASFWGLLNSYLDAYNNTG